MSSIYDGWVIKNKWGSLLFWTFGLTKRDVLSKMNDIGWFKEGFKEGEVQVVKVKFIEVK